MLKRWVSDLREHWDDRYWWVDHPELRAALVGVISGTLALLFLWLQLSMRARYARRLQTV